MVSINAELRSAVVLTAGYEDFCPRYREAPEVWREGLAKAEAWREAYFMLLGMYNTLSSRFYSVDICDTKREAQVVVVVPVAHADYVRGMLKSFGYQISCDETTTVAIVDPYSSKESFTYAFCEW